MRTQDFDPDLFKKVVGRFPTGLTVVTGVRDGLPQGMTLQSFMSLSLDPALIAIAVARTSTTWPNIEAGGSFAVNVLARHHSSLARTFSLSPEKRFESVAYSTSKAGNPVLDEAVTWLDCTLDNVLDGGDHIIAIGRVVELKTHDEQDDVEPIVFYRSGFRALTELQPA
ncbi:flavin reductase family protein [Rhodococcus sp. Z13]|uniref:Flavin reductase family protein n=1 Tax=Rhodococcus sacchari TaxID=2962047 RepID=A0ACD4DHK4_9NOCA|nr:flavin reductase family protein [Rhodococcus sp. Z13]UYP19550.1 flavin reductase family protein [Rhodococcus sp. Z13]